MTYLYHYQVDPATLALIMREGLKPLSEMPAHPAYPNQCTSFERRYEELGRPLLRRPYSNSGVFFTTTDLRCMRGAKRLDCTRLRIPASRLDPEWSVLTYELEGQRRWLKLGPRNLGTAAMIWTDELVQRWLAADSTGWFRYVPQVVTFQPGGVSVVPSDVEPGLS